MADGPETQQPAEPNPALDRLDVMVGTWDLRGRESGPDGDIHGQVVFEWMEGGFYLVQRVDIEHIGRRIKGVEYIGYDEFNENLKSYFFGNTGPGPFGGVALEYVWEVSDDTLTIWGGFVGSPASFKGKFSDDGNTITGGWEWPGGGYAATLTRVR
ncbi:MAG: DUF1579 family protein [Actinomycetota bacterium]|jgi:hypothetical protein|nr:DUF1579 family protein [Rubrobacter sp.]MDQ3236479.1 DUF1579 family protein [Actinomycetota bacterium]